MNKRGINWIVVVALLSSLLTISGTNSAQAASTTTTTARISDSNPNAGDTVVFTVIVTPTTFGSPITGNVVIAHSRGELCASSTLTESNPNTHAVTATCSWVATLEYENVKATYKGDTNYSASNSANFSGITAITVVGVTELSIPRTAEGSSMILRAWTNAGGTVAFKVNGSLITGCESKSVISNEALCTYPLPISNSAQMATRLFSVDFTPTSKSTILNAYSKTFTPDAYYLPSGGNIFQSTYSGFNNASSAQPYRNSGYIEVNDIFYKLNRSTLEAMVVGYNRFVGISQLVIPSNLQVLTGNVPNDKQSFVGNYEVTTLGSRAFLIALQTPTTDATLLTSVILPPTLKVIGDQVFEGQCGITSLEIPDSVVSIGTDTFKSMNSNGGVNSTAGYNGCTGPASTGLKNLTLGAGVASFGSYPFYAAGALENVVFRGSPSDLKSLALYRNSIFDQWEFTDVNVSNYSLHHPISGEPSRNSCSLFFTYVGSLRLSILATQSIAWQYWAQGCLSGTLTLQASVFKPSRPSSPSISNISHTSALVSFAPPTSDGGDTITSYSVLYSGDDWATSNTASSTISALSSSFSVTGLTPSTSYKFKVIATNGVGASLASQTSAAVTTLTPTPPAAPTIGTVAGTTGSTVSIPYTAGAINGSAITGYTTTSSPSIALTLTSAATANPLTYSGNFVQGQAYTFSMTATNGAGTSSSSSASNSITPYAAASPAAGIIGSVTTSNATTVSIPFTAPAINGSAITSYTITSSPALALTYSGTTSPVAITGAFVQGQSYTFTIAATNAAGTGAASSASNAVTPFAAGIPDAPTNIIAVATSKSTASISFTAPASNRGSTILSYTATSTPGNITATLMQAGSGTILLTGLNFSTQYTFTVIATNTVGSSSASVVSSSITTFPDTEPGLISTFSSLASYDHRFTVQVANYDSAFTYAVSSTVGSASINAAGLITVNSLGADQSATVTVTTTRAGYEAGIASIMGKSQVAPMLPRDKPVVTLAVSSIMCTMGSHSAAPTSSIFSLFVDGKHISTIFSAVGEYLPDWIVPWATSSTIARTATLTNATWAMSDAYKGKSITCTTIAYSKHAIGMTSSKAVIVP
jgi:hypothetical protein